MNAVKKAGRMRIRSILLILCMIVSMLPMTAGAAKAATPITSVSVYYVDAPVVGQTAYAGGVQVVTNPESAADVIDIFWWDCTDNRRCTIEDNFLATHDYKYVMILAPKSGYSFTFAPSPEATYPVYTGVVTINSKRTYDAQTNVGGVNLELAGEVVKPESASSTTTKIGAVQLYDIPTPAAGYPCTLEGIGLYTFPFDAAKIGGLEWIDQTANTCPDETDTFIEGHEYSIRATVIASPGYSFKTRYGNVFANTVTFDGVDNVGSADVMNNGTRLTARSASRVARKPITNISVRGVTEPVVGEAPTTEGIVATSPNAKVLEDKIYWMEEGEEGSFEYVRTPTFEAGKTYWVMVTVAPTDESTYVFTDDVTGTLNGKSAYDVVDCGGIPGNQKELRYCFGVLEEASATRINTVSVNSVPYPVAGKPCTTQGIDLYTDPNNAATLVSLAWKKANGTTLTENDTFVEGESYSLVAIINPKDGYEFAYDSNGQYTGQARLNSLTSDGTASRESAESVRLRFVSENMVATSAGPESISKVALSNVPTPVAGQPITTDGITLTTVPANAIKDAQIRWSDATDPNASSDTFMEGHDYYITALLTPKEEYKFDFSNRVYNGTATINGVEQYNARSHLLFQTKLYIVGSQKTATAAPKAEVRYMTHIQLNGWEKTWKKDGQMSGTSGESKRLEGIKIDLGDTNVAGSIEYRTHIQLNGWEKTWKKDGEMSGTSGEAKRLEAIQIRLTGEMAEKYDVYYRVHAQNFGWMDWAKNGEYAGTAGFAYRLEGIEIKLVKKGDPAPGSTKTPYRYPFLNYTTHVQDYGWQPNVLDGVTSGTVGKSKRLEAIKIQLKNQEYAGNIEYKTHIQNIGWETSWKKNGAMSGTSGKAYRLEAIQIRLTDRMAAKYDIYYRVHAQNFGWMGWAKNGASAGTAGFAYRLEGIQIVIVPKGDPAPGSTANCFRQK